MKKSVLALMLAVLMAVSLLTVGAMADGATYEVTVVEDEPEYIKPSDTYKIAYFYFTTSNCEVSRNGVKLDSGLFSGEYEIDSVEFKSITYRVKGTDNTYVEVPKGLVEEKTTYFTINLDNDESNTFTANSYEIKAEVKINGTYTPDEGAEETFSCAGVNAVFDLVVSPYVTGLTLTSSVNEISIDYETQGKLSYKIPVSIKNQDNDDVTGFCGMEYSKDGGETYISVPLVSSDNGFAVQLYPFAAGIMDDATLMFKAVYEGESGKIYSEPISIDVEVTNQDATAFAKFNGNYYSDLGDAISDALRTTNESETIEILRDVYVAGCNYTINKNLTFSSTNGATVTAMVKAVDNHTPGYENWTAEQIDEKNRDMVAFYIADGKTLTLDGVFLVINGNVDKDENGNEAGYDGTAIAAGKGAKLFVREGGLTLSGLNRGTTAGDNAVQITFAESVFNVDNIDGNVSNGGNILLYYSSAIVNNVGNYGLSVTSLALNNSAMTMENVAYSAIFCNGGGIDLDKSSISIINCGSGLPYEGYTKADSVVDYDDHREGMNVSIDNNSSFSIIGSNSATNYINIGGGTINVYGTLNAVVKYDDAESCLVVVEGKIYCVANVGDTITLPEAPTNSGYIFLGWRCEGETYSAKQTVTVNSDMTFTAVWGNLPDVKPSEPSEPETPVFPFYDVTARDWYYSAVKYVYEKGLMDGVDVGVFAPNDTLTRAMVWTIIARAEGVDTTGGATWYAKAQEWVTAKGISDGENPSAAITRQELVTMLYRLAGEPAVSGTITAPDASSVSTWAQSAMTWAMNIGLVEGDENGAVTPTATATRAQAAALIMRYLEA